MYVSIQEIVEDISKEFPDVLETRIERYVVFILQDFFRRSESWRATEVITLEKGNYYYDLSLPFFDTYASSVIDSKLTKQNGVVKRLQFVTPRLINLTNKSESVHVSTENRQVIVEPEFETGDELTVRYVIQPSRFIKEIPDYISEGHFDTIRNGVISRVLVSPNMPSGDKSLAPTYFSMYEQGVLLAKREARADNSNPKRVAKYNQDYKW